MFALFIFVKDLFAIQEYLKIGECNFILSYNLTV